MHQAHYLTFQLSGEEYAVSILRVKEIITYGTVTVVPQTPPFIRGVINLRGSVVPVLDLALKFGLRAAPVTNRTCIIIVEASLDAEPTVMGIIADSVSQVGEISSDEILPTPPFGTRVKVNFLQGMGKAGARFVLILDIDKAVFGEELGIANPPSAAVAPAPS